MNKKTKLHSDHDLQDWVKKYHLILQDGYIIKKLSYSYTVFNLKQIEEALLEYARTAALLTGGKIVEGFDTAGYWQEFYAKMKPHFRYKKTVEKLYETAWMRYETLEELFLCRLIPENREDLNQLMQKVRGEMPALVFKLKREERGHNGK